MPRRTEPGVYQRGKQGGGQEGQWSAVVELGRRGGKRDRRRFTGATAAEATAKRRRWLEDQAAGFELPKGRPPRTEEWIRHWLRNIARTQVQAKTWDGYRQRLEDHAIPFLGQIPLPELDEDDIRAWHAWLRKKTSTRTGRPLSPVTIGHAHRVLSEALEVAAAGKRRRMPYNPCTLASPAAPGDEPPPEPAPPEEDEVHRILIACEDRRMGARWVTGMATGLRQAEMLGMLWPCLDIADVDGASLAVEWTLVRYGYEHGCGDPHACGAGGDTDPATGKRRPMLHRHPCPKPCPKVRPSGRPHICRERDDPECCPPGCTAHASRCPQATGTGPRGLSGLRLKRPKSAASRAAIPVAPIAAAALRLWRQDQRAERLACPAWTGWGHDPKTCARRLKPRELVCLDCMRPARPDLLVWTQPSGMPVDNRRDWQDWSDLLGEAGLPHYGTHANRHGLATMLLEEGEDPRLVQALMRHASQATTDRIYKHVRPKLERQGAASIDRALRRARER